jgi:hypothetical protein
MAIKINDIYNAIKGLEKNHDYSFYWKGNANSFSFLKVEADTGRILFRRNVIKDDITDSKQVTVSSRNIEKLASKIRPYVPFQIDVIVGASGNWRSLFESALAHTPNFFVCHINDQRRLIYAPNHEHATGSVEVASASKLQEFSKLSNYNDYRYFIENCYPFDNCYLAFMNGLIRVMNIIRKVDTTYNSIYDINDPDNYKAILAQVLNDYPGDLDEQSQDSRFNLYQIACSYLLYLKAKVNYAYY